MNPKRKWASAPGPLWELKVDGKYRGFIKWTGDGWRWFPAGAHAAERTHERLGDCKRSAR